MLSLIEQVQNTNAPDADRGFLALISVLPSLRLKRHTHPLYWDGHGLSKAPLTTPRSPRRGSNTRRRRSPRVRLASSTDYRRAVWLNACSGRDGLSTDRRRKLNASWRTKSRLQRGRPKTQSSPKAWTAPWRSESLVAVRRGFTHGEKACRPRARARCLSSQSWEAEDDPSHCCRRVHYRRRCTSSRVRMEQVRRSGLPINRLVAIRRSTAQQAGAAQPLLVIARNGAMLLQAVRCSGGDETRPRDASVVQAMK